MKAQNLQGAKYIVSTKYNVGLLKHYGVNVKAILRIVWSKKCPFIFGLLFWFSDAIQKKTVKFFYVGTLSGTSFSVLHQCVIVLEYM